MVNFTKINDQSILSGNNNDLIKNSKLILKLSEYNNVELIKKQNNFFAKITNSNSNSNGMFVNTFRNKIVPNDRTGKTNTSFGAILKWNVNGDLLGVSAPNYDETDLEDNNGAVYIYSFDSLFKSDPVPVNILKPRTNSRYIYSIDWSPDNKKLIIASQDKIFIYDTDKLNNSLLNPDPIKTIEINGKPYIVTTLWSPDSNKIAFSNYGQDQSSSIYVYDLITDTYKFSKESKLSYVGNFMSWSSDSKMIFFSTRINNPLPGSDPYLTGIKTVDAYGVNDLNTKIKTINPFDMSNGNAKSDINIVPSNTKKHVALIFAFGTDNITNYEVQIYDYNDFYNNLNPLPKYKIRNLELFNMWGFWPASFSWSFDDKLFSVGVYNNGLDGYVDIYQVSELKENVINNNPLHKIDDKNIIDNNNRAYFGDRLSWHPKRNILVIGASNFNIENSNIVIPTQNSTGAIFIYGK